MDDDLGTADERGSKRMGAGDPLHFRLLVITQLPKPKGHRSAPQQMGMPPQ
jgi:hypothetical protein